MSDHRELRIYIADVIDAGTKTETAEEENVAIVRMRKNESWESAALRAVEKALR